MTMRTALALASTLIAGAAAAQNAPATAPGSGTVAQGPWVLGAAAGVVHQFESGLDGGGDVSIDRAFGQVSLSYAFDRRTSVGVALSGGLFAYDFSNGATLGGGDPWGRINEARIGLPIRFGLGEAIDVTVVPSLRWNAENGVSFDDGRTEGVIAGAVYRVSPGFAIGPGIGVFSQLSDDASVFPFLVLDWDVTDRINIGTASGFGATQGPGLEVTYRFDGGWRVAAGARWEEVEFRLDDSGPAPDGIGETQTLPLFVTATYAPTPMTSLSAIVGLDVMGEVTLMDRNGGKIESREIDPAPFIGLGGSLRF